METGVSMQQRREPRTLVPSWTQAHRRGGQAVNPSQVGFHLIKREWPLIPFKLGRKNLKFLKKRTPPCLLVYSEPRVAVTIGGRRAALGLDSRGRLSPRNLGRAGRPSLCRNPILDLISTRDLGHEQACQAFSPTIRNKRNCCQRMCATCWGAIIFVFCCTMWSRVGICRSSSTPIPRRADNVRTIRG